jgi:hypothetical protein
MLVIGAKETRWLTIGLLLDMMALIEGINDPNLSVFVSQY